MPSSAWSISGEPDRKKKQTRKANEEIVFRHIDAYPPSDEPDHTIPF
jgi:hypothetical protein